MKYKNPNEKKSYLLAKLKNLDNRVTKNGSYKLNWAVGVSPHPTLREVCKKCFEKCYMYKRSTLNYLIRSIKANLTAAVYLYSLKFLSIGKCGYF